MENQIRNAMMAQKQLTVTYTVEEAIKIAEVFDMMLSNLAVSVMEEGVNRRCLDDALVLNVFVGRLRQCVFDIVMGEKTE